MIGSQEMENKGKKRANGDRQTLDEKRRLRACYRELTTNIEGEKQQLLNGDPSKLLERLQKGNELFDKVKTTQEAVLDSTFILKTIDIAAQKAQKMKLGGVGFDIDEYIAKLMNKISEDESNWNGLTSLVKGCCSQVPAVSFMFGPLGVEPKVRAARKTGLRLNKDKLELKRPDQLTDKDIDRDSNETSLNVQRVYHRLTQVEPINFFKFIVNPLSFGQTVENLFHLSFLVRDAKVSIEESEESGELVLETCEPPTLEEQQEEDFSKLQNILQLDMDIWRKAIELYSITESIIPHRDTTIVL
ncbi:Nse4 C-terminal-domain-containing protein [Globomyces pollinis-pini]|nr:Nse4 C-terminal-domain-containing protein [Globomyces pollinis-pini]